VGIQESRLASNDFKKAAERVRERWALRGGIKAKPYTLYHSFAALRGAPPLAAGRGRDAMYHARARAGGVPSGHGDRSSLALGPPVVVSCRQSSFTL
jgi:hypothetical protein